MKQWSSAPSFPGNPSLFRQRSAAILLSRDLLCIIWTRITWGIKWCLVFYRIKYGENMAVYPSKCVWKGRRKVFFTFSRFLRKDGFIGFTRQCDDFDGHSMVSKMVIEFFLCLTTIRLAEFVYRLTFHITYVVVVGLRVKHTGSWTSWTYVYIHTLNRGRYKQWNGMLD